MIEWSKVMTFPRHYMQCMYVRSKEHRDLDNSVFVSFPEICFDYVLYFSHMLGHVTSSANDQLYTIKINKDFLMRLLKRWERIQKKFNSSYIVCGAYI